MSRFLKRFLLTVAIAGGAGAIAGGAGAVQAESPGESTERRSADPAWHSASERELQDTSAGKKTIETFFRVADFLTSRDSFDPATIRLVQLGDDGSTSLGDFGDLGGLGGDGSPITGGNQPGDDISPLLASNTLGSGLESLDFSSLEAALPSLEITTLNTPQAVEAIEQVTQRNETAASLTAPVEIVPSSTFNLVSVPDAAETLTEVAATPAVRARRRSPIGFDTRIRGFYEGQIYTNLDSAFQTPVRGDLDATLTRLDPSLIAATQVISGPYGVRYGNGFSFLNVTTIPTPRYEGGSERHLRLGSFIRTNGGQTFNSATLLGGSRRWGYFANVGYRKGSDYEAGNGLDIPSSYDSFSIFSGLGFDLSPDARVETKVSLLQQGDTEYAGQFSDIDDLDSYGITHSIIRDVARKGIGYRFDFWFNTTDFDGNTDTSSKRRSDFPILQRIDDAIVSAGGTPIPGQAIFEGDVNGRLTTAGVRASVTKEFDDLNTISAGMDYRYVQQTIEENFDINATGVSDVEIQTGLPGAETFDPGFFLEATSALSEDINVAAGGRMSFVRTQADASELRERSNFTDLNGDLDEDFDVSDILGSFFFTSDITLTQAWSSRLGMGYAERLPNLTDRYSDGLFLAIIQSGFSRVIGNPTIRKERNWQLDARLDGEFGDSRVRLTAFHSWILDYVTYRANETDPLGSRLLQAINTDLATLYGYEAYGEYDWTPGIQAFASLAYLRGTDQVIDQNLAGISPLESRLGVRFTDPSPENSRGVELGLRLVNGQDRLAAFRPALGGSGLIPLETDTPGFGVAYIRGYLRPNDTLSFTGGIENLFDNDYFEHLNLRLPETDTLPAAVVLSPGFTPYFGMELNY
ncbi:MAG: TonB-dependent receptor [Planctomycetota bacterium]